MTSKQLGKLEELAGKRADQSRSSLEREKRKLAQIEHHRTELRAISHEYQQALIGEAEVGPQQLAHRRAFVEQLIHKLDELSEQSDQKRQSVHTKSLEHQQRAAQHTAIDIVNNQRIDADSLSASQRQQQQLDEVGRGQHFERKRFEQESDSE